MSKVAARSSIAFSHPPRFIGLPGQVSSVTYSMKEYDDAVLDARQQARAEALTEANAEISEAHAQAAAVIDGAFSKIVEKHDSALGQMRALLPRLVTEAVSRVLAGIPVDAPLVKAVVNDLLAEVVPGADTVEVQLCGADLALVSGFDQELRHKFPSIHLLENKELAPGDCVVRTRFGVIDGRVASKLKAVEGLLR